MLTIYCKYWPHIVIAVTAKSRMMALVVVSLVPIYTHWFTNYLRKIFLSFIALGTPSSPAVLLSSSLDLKLYEKFLGWVSYYVMPASLTVGWRLLPLIDIASTAQMSVMRHCFASCTSLKCEVIRFAQRRLSAFGSLKMEVCNCSSKFRWQVFLMKNASQIVAVISQVTGIAADMIVFSTMCYSLRRARYPELVKWVFIFILNLSGLESSFYFILL